MHSFLRIIMISAFPIWLVGCQSTLKPIEPMDVLTNASEAYNIANQTYLLRDDSPLRDFSVEEIEENKVQMQRSSGGNVSKMVGVLSIMTGNLTGVIDVVGGSAAELAHSDHPSSEISWVIAMDAQPYKTAKEAEIAAVKALVEANIRLLESKGNEVQKFQVDKFYETIYTINSGTNTIMQVLHDGSIIPSMIETNSSLIEAKRQYVTVKSFNPIYLTSAVPFFLGEVKGYSADYEGYNQYLLDLTGMLPAGFYYYTPSFPESYHTLADSKENWYTYGGKNIRSMIIYGQNVPAIYTQGKKLEFIKP